MKSFSFFLYFSLVVGAPKFDTSNFQEQVSEAGAVFRCTMDGDNHCRLVPFDSKGMCNYSQVPLCNNCFPSNPSSAQLSPAPIPVAVSVPISVAVFVFVSVSISFPSVNRRVCLSVFCIGASGKKRKMQLVIYGSHACVAFPYPVDGTSVQSGVY